MSIYSSRYGIAGTNAEDDAMLEAIFVECTCYKPAGALTPEDRETVTNAVTEELMTVRQSPL